jgi:hypothetical protein
MHGNLNARVSRLEIMIAKGLEPALTPWQMANELAAACGLGHVNAIELADGYADTGKPATSVAFMDWIREGLEA